MLMEGILAKVVHVTPVIAGIAGVIFYMGGIKSEVEALKETQKTYFTVIQQQLDDIKDDMREDRKPR